MDSVTVKIDGFAELDRRMRALGPELTSKALRTALTAGGKVIRDEAKLKVEDSTDTGSLHDAIRVGFDRQASTNHSRQVNVFVKYKLKKYAENVKNKRSGRFGLKFADYGTLFYWRFIEFGTQFMAARPFLRPAFESKKHEALDKIRESLKKAVDKYGASK